MLVERIEILRYWPWGKLVLWSCRKDSFQVSSLSASCHICDCFLLHQFFPIIFNNSSPFGFGSFIYKQKANACRFYVCLRLLHSNTWMKILIRVSICIYKIFNLNCCDLNNTDVCMYVCTVYTWYTVMILVLTKCVLWNCICSHNQYVLISPLVYISQVKFVTCTVLYIYYYMFLHKIQV